MGADVTGSAARSICAARARTFPSTSSRRMISTAARPRRERDLVAAERSRVRPGRPHVEPLVVEDDRHGLADPGQRLRRHDDVRVIPYCSKANHVPVRPQPVCTSSTTSGMSSSRVSSRSRCTKSRSAETTPPSPCTSSSSTAAGRATPPFGSCSDRSTNPTQFVEHVLRVRPIGQSGQFEYGKKWTPGTPFPDRRLVGHEPRERHPGMGRSVEPP